MSSQPAAERVLRQALEVPVFTAAAAEVGDDSGARWQFFAGRLGVNDATAVDSRTIFDLASLTKVLSTASVALQLTRSRQLDLDARVSRVLMPWDRHDRSDVTVRDLLEHSSGLPAHRDYYRRVTGLSAYIETIASEPLEYEPRTRAVYSDLGFITLGAVLEQVAERALDAQFDEIRSAAHVDEPLTYRPPASWRSNTAATEFDAWRGRLIQGEVHDQNAAALDGVAAHAGLFGTAAAVGAMARWWLRQLDADDARAFTARSAVAGSSRALGWDTMLPTSSCGTLMSPAAIGHTGFTGTSLWIDPTRRRYFVLLTNRIHVSNTNDGIQRVRRDFHDAINREHS